MLGWSALRSFWSRAVLTLLVAQVGCVRAGFEPWIDGGVTGDGPVQQDAPPPPPHDGPVADNVTTTPVDGSPLEAIPAPPAITNLNDTCQFPFPLDLSKLPTTFVIDPAGANDDYKSCSGKPDLVVHYTNSPGQVVMSCTNTGWITVWHGSNPGTCPGSPVNSNNMACTMNNQTLNLGVGAGYFILCRTLSEKIATVTIKKP